MMENIMNAVNAVMSACRESLDHTNDDYERVTILVSRVGWVQVLNDAQVMKPECLLRVASRRWASTDGFHRLSGGNRPSPVIPLSPANGCFILKAVIQRPFSDRQAPTQNGHAGGGPVAFSSP